MAGELEDLTLGDLGRVVTGKTPLTAVEGNFGGQIPFVTPSDMDGRKTISATARYLTETGAASVKGSKIPAGSVMVSCIGSDMAEIESRATRTTFAEISKQNFRPIPVVLPRR